MNENRDDQNIAELKGHLNSRNGRTMRYRNFISVMSDLCVTSFQIYQETLQKWESRKPCHTESVSVTS